MNVLLQWWSQTAVKVLLRVSAAEEGSDERSQATFFYSKKGSFCSVICIVFEREMTLLPLDFVFGN